MESKCPRTPNRLRCQIRTRRVELSQDGTEQLLQKRDAGIGLLRPERNADFGEFVEQKKKERKKKHVIACKQNK